MTPKPFAAATERNSLPILRVLQDEFAQTSAVLEIGSGTGQHAVRFGAALQHLEWQTSELSQHHDGIRAWLEDGAPPNVRAPIVLDVESGDWPEPCYDGVFSANTAHIMSVDAVVGMFAGVGRVLCNDGRFCLYGPIRQGGDFNTSSNAAFDASLRARDPAMGIRDLEDLDGLAAKAGLRRVSLYAMPANNHLVVWRKHSGTLPDGRA